MRDDTREFLMRVIEENWRHQRLSEDKRATLANVVLFAFVAAQLSLGIVGFGRRMLPAALMLILLGVYALLVSAKLYERDQFHTRRARQLRGHLDGLLPDARVNELQAAAEKDHRPRYPTLVRLRLNRIWLTFHTAIAAIGTIEAVICLLGGE